MKGINEVLKMKDTKQKCSYLLKWYLAVQRVVLVLKAFILKIAFNLFVMRSCFSRKNRPAKVSEYKPTYNNPSTFKDATFISEQFDIIESNDFEIVLGEGDSFPPFPYKPFLL